MNLTENYSNHAMNQHHNSLYPVSGNQKAGKSAVKQTHSTNKYHAYVASQIFADSGTRVLKNCYTRFTS